VVGGYAILEQPNAGLVLATSARFRTTVSVDKHNAWPAHDAAGEHELAVRVISPQFSQDIVFAVTDTKQQQNDSSASAHRGIRVRELRTDQPNNSYVRDTLAVAMTAVVALSERASSPAEPSTLSNVTRQCNRQGLGVSILLQADNDFYSQVGRLQSQQLPLTRASLATVPPYAPCLANESGDVAKTGLGSSAAMITSLSAALMCFLNVAKVHPQEPRLVDADVALVHKVAQVCHAAAQGKIGSGFDVCAAVYGSAEYVRYSTAVLAPLLVTDDAVAGEREAYYSCESVANCIGVDASTNDEQSLWDYTANSFGLPRGIDMACADINGGSESPSMSRTVSVREG
jgi:phosphomevalonate kinase